MDFLERAGVMQVQRELKAAKAEKQRLSEMLESKESEALKLSAQLDLMHATPPPRDDDEWLVSAAYGDMGQ